jgi:hypothetical protein
MSAAGFGTRGPAIAPRGSQRPAEALLLRPPWRRAVAWPDDGCATILLHKGDTAEALAIWASCCPVDAASQFDSPFCIVWPPWQQRV